MQHEDPPPAAARLRTGQEIIDSALTAYITETVLPPPPLVTVPIERNIILANVPAEPVVADAQWVALMNMPWDEGLPFPQPDAGDAGDLLDLLMGLDNDPAPMLPRDPYLDLVDLYAPGWDGVILPAPIFRAVPTRQPHHMSGQDLPRREMRRVLTQITAAEIPIIDMCEYIIREVRSGRIPYFVVTDAFKETLQRRGCTIRCFNKFLGAVWRNDPPAYCEINLFTHRNMTRPTTDGQRREDTRLWYGAKGRLPRMGASHRTTICRRPDWETAYLRQYLTEE